MGWRPRRRKSRLHFASPAARRHIAVDCAARGARRPDAPIPRSRTWQCSWWPPDWSTSSQVGLTNRGRSTTDRRMQPAIDETNLLQKVSFPIGDESADLHFGRLFNFFTGTTERPSTPERLRAPDTRHKPVPSSSEYLLHVLAGRPLQHP